MLVELEFSNALIICGLGCAFKSKLSYVSAFWVQFE
jgi:hypothetical protein